VRDTDDAKAMSGIRKIFCDKLHIHSTGTRFDMHENSIKKALKAKKPKKGAR
jgi:hypothetical protein